MCAAVPQERTCPTGRCTSCAPYTPATGAMRPAKSGRGARSVYLGGGAMPVEHKVKADAGETVRLPAAQSFTAKGDARDQEHPDDRRGGQWFQGFSI